jgi:ADP-ribose pyrophosphatase YjhB (NUDIX family)
MEKPSYIRFIRSKVKTAKIILNAACAVIADEDGKVLLQKRSDNKKWGLPGGLLELDESIQDAVLREVKEETDLDIELTDFIGVFVNPDMRWRVADDAEVICFSFVGKIVGGTLKINDSESLAFGYFGRGELPEIHSVDNVQTIQAYFDHRHHLVEGRQF